MWTADFVPRFLLAVLDALLETPTEIFSVSSVSYLLTVRAPHWTTKIGTDRLMSSFGRLRAGQYTSILTSLFCCHYLLECSPCLLTLSMELSTVVTTSRGASQQ